MAVRNPVFANPEAAARPPFSPRGRERVRIGVRSPLPAGVLPWSRRTGSSLEYGGEGPVAVVSFEPGLHPVLAACAASWKGPMLAVDGSGTLCSHAGARRAAIGPAYLFDPAGPFERGRLRINPFGIPRWSRPEQEADLEILCRSFVAGNGRMDQRRKTQGALALAAALRHLVAAEGVPTPARTSAFLRRGEGLEEALAAGGYRPQDPEEGDPRRFPGGFDPAKDLLGTARFLDDLLAPLALDPIIAGAVQATDFDPDAVLRENGSVFLMLPPGDRPRLGRLVRCIADALLARWSRADPPSGGRVLFLAGQHLGDGPYEAVERRATRLAPEGIFPVLAFGNVRDMHARYTRSSGFEDSLGLLLVGRPIDNKTADWLAKKIAAARPDGPRIAPEDCLDMPRDAVAVLARGTAPFVGHLETPPPAGGWPFRAGRAGTTDTSRAASRPEPPAT